MMKTTLKTCGLMALASTSLFLTGCATTAVNPGAERVMVTNQVAPKSCKFLGMATGNQGNFFTGQFTSNKNMQAGAFNSLRNEAAAMGGNRVVLLMKQASMTEGNNSGAQTNVATTGNVYFCPGQSGDAAPAHHARAQTKRRA